MICPTCARETSAVVELGEMGGPSVRRCAHLGCKAALPRECVTNTMEIGVSTTQNPGQVARQVGAVLACASRLRSLTPSNSPLPTFAQIVEQSEARLLQIREQILELRALEAEERQLVLILAAAGKALPESRPS